MQNEDQAPNVNGDNDDQGQQQYKEYKIDKDELFDLLKDKIRQIKRLPNQGHNSFPTNTDLLDLYVLLCAFLRSL